jgi:DNA-binding beta-propeller fold protein YncE
LQLRVLAAVLGTVITVLCAGRAHAQTTAATFGQIIQLGGTPSDMVLDESRGRLYLVNSNANRVDVYSYLDSRLMGSIPVGQTPLAAAMSMDNAFLYVTNNTSSTLSVIDLGNGIGNIQQTISLPARPEGVEAGADGRVLISTGGTGTNNTANTLLIYDRNQANGQQVLAVPFPPPPPTPTQLGQVFIGRPATTFRGKLLRTPDGNRIIGVSTINNNAQTIAYVYETASGTILQSRTVTGQSTVLSMSPDGARFMAGFTLYDTATLQVLAQESTANAPFTLTGSFATQQNVGGSAFSPDGATVYGAFNTTPLTQPPSRPTSSTLLIEDPQSLGITLGIKLPESIVAKMVVTSDGANAWGMSESGLIYLPLSTLYDYPILMPDTTNVFLAQDDCHRGIASAKIKVNNIGKGKLTFAVPSTISGGSAAIVVQASSGLAPADLTFTMDPGRAGVNREPGTNLYSGAATNNGFAVNLSLASNEAINVPPTIRIYMNYRQSDQRGIIYPLPTVPNNNNEGLNDLVLDEDRGKLYITNSGYNRIEVFDIGKQKFAAPIPVGQLPHQMAMGLDGSTLYVAHTGGESIGMVDLDAGALIDKVQFPPIPRQGNTGVVFPRAMATGLSGLQFMMSNGTLWKVVGGAAVPRPASQIINGNTNTTQVPIANPGASQMISSPDNTSIFLLNGNGTGYLYDALSDSFTASRQLFSNPIISYYGPLGAAPKSSYFLANGLVLNNSLTPIGGATSPGTVTVGPAPAPGQPPSVSVVSAGQRNIAAVAAVDEDHFVRMTTPVRQNLTATTRDDRRTTLEAVDIRTGAESLVGVIAENPVFEVFGTARQAIPPRQMIADSLGNIYSLTISGLSVIPLTPAGANTRPQIAPGPRAIVNADGSATIKPGAFITITGQNLASAAAADDLPVPTVLGGSCVVFNDVALPLLQTSTGQISAQIPQTVRSGTNVVQVRSLATAQQSDPLVITVGKN